MNNAKLILKSLGLMMVCAGAVVLINAACDSSDGLSVETLEGGRVYVAEGLGLQSTAGKGQTGIIETLKASAGGHENETLVVEYPFDGAVFPPEFVSPMFVWRDDTPDVDTWLVDIELPGGSIRALVPKNPLPEPIIDQACFDLTEKENPPYPPYQPPETNWTPPDEVWEKIKSAGAADFAVISFYGFNSSNPEIVLSKGDVRIAASKDPVGAPIFYRDVPMIGVKRKLENEVAGLIKPIPSAAQDLIKWSLRDVSRRESRVVLEDMPTCANCHSFSADGSALGMDIDGPGGDKGGYAIAGLKEAMVIGKDDIISWNYAYKKKFRKLGKTIGFLSQLSPDGNYAVTTLNEQVFVSNYRDHKFIQVFYPTRGYLGYYSGKSGEVNLLPGADSDDYVHCDPTWSPDGSFLVFAGATARDSNIEGQPRPLYANDPNETPIQYDLYRIPFNDGHGGKKELIPGASGNGMSNTFPKISPDGKWIVFVKCNNGQLMRPDSRLWIVPTDGGKAREMNCNLDLMNSWHTFSPNGRWMAFSSKGMGPYTRLFLTHIDENGNDTPPVLVPNCTAPNRAVNIPEFVNIDYDDLKTIDVPAVDFYRHHKRALALGDQGRFKEALNELKLALAEEPDDIKVKWELHHRTGLALQRFGDIPGAIEQWKKAIETDSGLSSEPYFLIALSYANQRQFSDAYEYFEKTVELSPKHTRALYYMAQIRIEKEAKGLYNPKKAINIARTCNDLTHSREPIMLEILGWAYAEDGRFGDALDVMEKALELARPREIEDHIRRIEMKIATYKEGKKG